ncbi:unnamed protein product [Chondrus crispus]|uniref:Importin N-terminal domain-containing protein n=1 Tax=Chondrus crispus TaxID=2769 RepID=R7QHA4_CHOCR|nr:unnamed protein product [Chondrus crispus]CDF37444.1 unnamed protein product [Chondrus crispus]|eukprot:XP_005717263.1 unnamed protein product [Chondrus crispus]
MITAASDADAPPNVRWLAAVCGKNAVSRSWRRRTHPNAVTEDERTYVKDTLLQKLGEQHSTVAIQISVWVSRIARIDFPNGWPSLITDLCEKVKCSNEQVMFHSLSTLDLVIEGISSKRLHSDRKRFYQVAPAIFGALYEHFVVHLQTLIQNPNRQDGMKKSFSVVEKCLECFQKLVNYGSERITAFQHLPSVFSKFIDMPELFLRGAAGGTELQLRLSHLAAELIVTTQKRDPVHFQEFLPKFLEIYYNCLMAFRFGTSDESACFQAALFVRNVLECPDYDLGSASFAEFKAKRGTGVKMPDGVCPQACRYILLSFFDENRVNALIESLISNVFILSNRELETWANDPEALVREEDAADWGTESLRKESEGIFSLLFLRDWQRIAPMITRLTESIPADNPLLLDACYRALGRATRDCRNAFNLADSLNGKLGAILKADCSKNLGERIIQARAAWLIGQCAEQVSRELRQIVNPLLVRLMGFTDGDLVIALTATKTIQHLAEDLGFHSEDFAPQLSTCVLHCFRLVNIAETYATKRDLLGTIVSLIRRSNAQYVVPLIESVANVLTPLWRSRQNGGGSFQTSGENFNGTGIEMGEGGENLLRVAIAEVLVAMIEKTGEASMQSSGLRTLSLEVIAFAVNVEKGMGGSYMMEDGCELWAVVVEASSEYSEELARLFPQTERILGLDFDYLREVFRLLEGYALLGRERFMNQYGAAMLATLRRALGSVRDRGCLAAVEVLDVILLLFPSEGVGFLAPILQDALQKIIENEESQVVSAAYTGLIARACLVKVGDFEGLVLQGNEMAAVEVVEAMLKNLDSMYKLRRRKLVTVAVCGLARRYGKSTSVLQRVPSVLNAVVQVLSEEQHRAGRHATEEHPKDFLNAVARFGEGARDEEGFTGKGVELPGQRRKRDMWDGDVVEKVKLREVCGGLLMGLKEDGEENYQAILRATDPVVLAQLGKLVQPDGTAS